jgi:hypothetical protein
MLIGALWLVAKLYGYGERKGELLVLTSQGDELF